LAARGGRPAFRFGLLVIAIAVALLTWIVLNGTNSIHFEAPAN
jgi:putative oxidoreductase